MDLLAKFFVIPDPSKYPHAYRWYIHIAALTGTHPARPPGTEEEEKSHKDNLALLTRQAQERNAIKEAKQRTLVAIEIKPYSVDQDLIALWRKITQTVTQDGLKWGETCTLADVAYGIKKIQCTFVMGVENSSDDVVEAIEAMEDDVQSCDVVSMNVL